MTQIKRIKIRDFSVGYSAEETERLQRDTAISQTYNLYFADVVKNEEGTKFTMGAYNGYYTDKVTVDGVEIPYGERVELINALKKAYSTQNKFDILQAKIKADALMKINLAK